MSERSIFNSGALSAPQKFQELVNRHAGIGDDAPERARAYHRVIGNDDPRIGQVATQNHVTAFLAPEHEAGSLESCADGPAR
jgi:hypothetical protein